MIACRIQAHPSREHLIPRLQAALEPLPTEVFYHSSHPPSPWEGYYQCLLDPPDCTHLLVIQDDAIPSRNFVPALETIAERFPALPVCLFLSGVPSSAAAQARRVAKANRRRYVPLGACPFVPLVAVLWPRSKAEEFRQWAETTARRMTRADDGNAGKWVRETRQIVMVTVPSIVEHDENEESVKGGRPWRGSEVGRKAALFADDALTYEW